LNLPLSLYTEDPSIRFGALAETQRALRNVLGYRLYLDLRRGWRITSPNLEQCGLLEIKYLSLQEVCEAEDIWQNCHPALAMARPETRAKVAKVLLDYMRRELAIKVDYLDNLFQEQISSLVLKNSLLLGRSMRTSAWNTRPSCYPGAGVRMTTVGTFICLPEVDSGNTCDDPVRLTNFMIASS
jgi:hypothetical protein